MELNPNPWTDALQEPDEEPEAPAVPEGKLWVPGGADVRVRGGLPCVDVDEGAGALWVVGAHGGAGTTTWANLLGAGDSSMAWPRCGATPLRVVIAARSCRTGLRAAQAAATQWGAGDVPGVHLGGLLLGADAPGRPLKALADYKRLISGLFPKVWEVPWVESWRLSERAWDVPLSKQPRPIRRIATEVNELREVGA